MCAFSALGSGGPALDAGAEAAPGALVEGAVADHDVGHARGHGQRRLLDGRARRAAAVVDAAEEGQLADAETAGDVDVGVGVGAEGDHAPAPRTGRCRRPLSAASTASAARRSSERPESLENSVAPMPAMAVRPENVCAGAISRAPRPSGRTTLTVPVTWSPRSLAPRIGDGHHAARAVVAQRALVRHRAGQRHGAARVVRRAEPDVDLRHPAARPRPVGDVATHQPVRGQDVHEDVLRAPLLGQHGIVVHVLVVPAGQGARHDQGAGDRQHQRRAARRPPRRRRRSGPGARRRRPAVARRATARGSAISAPSRRQLQARRRRAGARSACPTGSSGGWGTVMSAPMPPWRCWVACTVRWPRSEACHLATRAASAASRPVSKRQAAFCQVTRMASMSMAASAARSMVPWKVLSGRPNWWRALR